jgi:hypothetical protein
MRLGRGGGMIGGITTIGIGSFVLGSGGSLALWATQHGLHVDPALVQNDLLQRMMFWRLVVLQQQQDRRHAREMIEALRSETVTVREALDEERIYSHPKSESYQGDRGSHQDY